jgi:hypothetical protein
VQDVGHVGKSLLELGFGSFDRLGDLLDTSEAGIPGRTDRRQLCDRTSELPFVDVVPPLPAGGRYVHKSRPIEYAQVLGDCLTGYWELIAEGRGGSTAVGQQQVD